VKRLGVIGTMVWDTIHGRDPSMGPIDEWGGIAYALAALEAELPNGWEIVPLIKVGRDLAPRANEFLGCLTKRSAADRFVEVTEPNNRVTLRYTSATRRTEQLSGGVPGWSWEELGPLIHDVDAIYVNFISGFELQLETLQYLRHGFGGPIYTDLHSLLLGVAPTGLRVPRPLVDGAKWFPCFDVVQVNEDEISLLGPDPMAVAAHALNIGVRLLVVTLGDRGAVYFTVPPFDLMNRTSTHLAGPIYSALIEAPSMPPDCDPTGCGDVFGGTLISRLLDEEPLEAAIHHANRLAARNLTHKGATNLQYHLRGQIAPR